MAPVDRERVSLFALGTSLANLDQFLKAIEEANRLHFGRRPWILTGWRVSRKPKAASVRSLFGFYLLRGSRQTFCFSSQRTALCCNLTYSGFQRTDSRWPGEK
jgi:hypothetical protein